MGPRALQALGRGRAVGRPAGWGVRSDVRGPILPSLRSPFRLCRHSSPRIWPAEDFGEQSQEAQRPAQRPVSAPVRAVCFLVWPSCRKGFGGWPEPPRCCCSLGALWEGSGPLGN